MNEDKRDYLRSIYYDPIHPAAFSGIDKLYRAIKNKGRYVISKGQVTKWLQCEEIYTSHRQARKRFSRRRVIVPTKFYICDADNVNMTMFVNEKGYKYFLIMIDILSRYAWTTPLKSLKGFDMVKALKSTLDGVPQNFRSDSGVEFQNANVKRFLEKKNINQYRTTNETKANYAERCIKTIKSMLTKAMHHNSTRGWVTLLE